MAACVGVRGAGIGAACLALGSAWYSPLIGASISLATIDEAYPVAGGCEVLTYLKVGLGYFGTDHGNIVAYLHLLAGSVGSMQADGVGAGLGEYKGRVAHGGAL